MFKRWGWIIASICVLAVTPVVAHELGEKIQYEDIGGGTATGVVTKVIRPGELYRVEVIEGRLKGRTQTVRAEKIVSGKAGTQGRDEKPEATDEPVEPIEGELKIGDTIKFKEFGGSTGSGVITEILSNGQAFKINATAGKSKGKTTTVWRDDVLGLPDADESGDDAKGAGKHRVGEKIRYKTIGGEVREAVISEVTNSFYVVDITSGDRKGGRDHVKFKDVLPEGADLEPKPKAGADEEGDDEGEYRVGSKIRFKGFRDEVMNGVITEVRHDGKIFSVDVTSGSDTGKNQTVWLKDVLRDGELDRPLGILKPGDKIVFQEFGDGRGEGVITKVRHGGSVFEVDATSGRDQGKSITVWKKDVLAKTGSVQLTFTDGIKGIDLAEKVVKLRVPAVWKPTLSNETNSFWRVPAAKAVQVQAKPLNIKISKGSDQAHYSFMPVGEDVLVYASGATQRVNLVTGDVGKPIYGLMPIHVNPRGDHLLMSLPSKPSLINYKMPRDMLHSLAIKPDKSFEHRARIELTQRGAAGAMVAGIDQVLLSYGSGVSMHSLNDGKGSMMGKFTGYGGPVQQHNIYMINKLEMVDSPSGDGTRVQGTTISAFDTAGKLVGQRSLPMNFLQCALSPDGKKIILMSDADGSFHGKGDIVTVDLSTGAELGRLSMSLPIEGFKWIDDRFVFIEGKHPMVFDTKTHLVIWRFDLANSVKHASWIHNVLIAVADDTRSSADARLIVIPVQMQALAGIADRINPNEVLSIGPGSSIALDIEGASDRQAYASIIGEKLADAGITINPNAATRLFVTTKRTSVTREYSKGLRDKTKASVDQITIDLSLTAGGETLWSARKEQPAPFSIYLQQGESIQQAIQRVTGPEAEKRMVNRLPLPSRLMSDKTLEQVQSTAIK